MGLLKTLTIFNYTVTYVIYLLLIYRYSGLLNVLIIIKFISHGIILIINLVGTT